MTLSPPAGSLPPRIVSPRRGEQVAGIALFLALSVLWTLWWSFELIYGEDNYIPSLASPSDLGGLIAAVLSALCVVVTGYLFGRATAAVWLGWIPGALMVATGFLAVEQTTDNVGWLIFVGGLLLMFGWPLYFLPLLALGAYLRRRRARRLSPAVT